MVDDEILHVSKDVGVSLVQGPGHCGQVLLLSVIVRRCWLGIKDEGNRE
jgi:hypothetical protein